MSKNDGLKIGWFELLRRFFYLLNNLFISFLRYWGAGRTRSRFPLSFSVVASDGLRHHRHHFRSADDGRFTVEGQTSPEVDVRDRKADIRGAGSEAA